MLHVLRFAWELVGFVVELLLTAFVVGQGGSHRRPGVTAPDGSRGLPKPSEGGGSLPAPDAPIASPRAAERRYATPCAPTVVPPPEAAREVASWVRSVAPPVLTLPPSDPVLDRLEARRQVETLPGPQILSDKPRTVVDSSLVTALVKLGFRKADAVTRLERAVSELGPSAAQAELLRRALSYRTK